MIYLQTTGADTTIDIPMIREWLAPRDTVLRRLATNKEATRAEFTCEWFEKHLSEFGRSKDDLFLVTGTLGCGKSVLSSWIVERLQRPLGRKTFDVVSVKIGRCLGWCFSYRVSSTDLFFRRGLENGGYSFQHHQANTIPDV